MKLTSKAQVSLDKVIQKFSDGDMSPVVKIVMLERKGDPVPFDSWSLCNRIMTYIQSGGSTDLRGYRQWQKVGRQVQKGSCASFILVPRIVKKEDEDGKEESRLVGFMAVAVFPYGDTEGEPLPEHDYAPTEPPPLMEVAKRLGVEVTWRLLPPDRRGDINLAGTHINLGTHDIRTWFHELGHAAHARVNGKLEKGGQVEAKQEAVAEICAAVLTQMYGYDYSGNSWDYISRLYPQDPLRAIMKALSEVEKVLSVIFDEN